jgi:uncharacterized coiled-coil protein SlyX
MGEKELSDDLKRLEERIARQKAELAKMRIKLSGLMKRVKDSKNAAKTPK